MSAAASAVFNTFELLENILTHLPLADLARSRRTSSQLRDIIDRSQHDLFLTPTSTISWLQWHRPPGAVDWETSITDAPNRANEPHTYPVLTLHPAIEGERDLDRRTAIWTTIDLNRMRAWSPSGQWREMHITQPPTRKLTLHYRLHDEQFSDLPVEESDGVRLGTILDETHNLMQTAGPLTERRHHHRCRLRCYARPVIHCEVLIEIEGCVEDRSKWVAHALERDIPAVAAAEVVVAGNPRKMLSKPKDDKTSWLFGVDFR